MCAINCSGGCKNCAPEEHLLACRESNSDDCICDFIEEELQKENEQQLCEVRKT
jgi:hypothetical protein